MLTLEQPPHRRGERPPVWVARITDVGGRYGYTREFLRPMNDYSQARSRMSGSIAGITSTYAMRDGVYEVSGPRTGYFLLVESGASTRISPADVARHV